MEVEFILICRECIHMFRTGDGLLVQEDKTTVDGLMQIFATNLFGHFLLVKYLNVFLSLSLSLSVYLIFHCSPTLMIL